MCWLISTSTSDGLGVVVGVRRLLLPPPRGVEEAESDRRGGFFFCWLVGWCWWSLVAHSHAPSRAESFERM